MKLRVSFWLACLVVTAAYAWVLWFRTDWTELAALVYPLTMTVLAVGLRHRSRCRCGTCRRMRRAA